MSGKYGLKPRPLGLKGPLQFFHFLKVDDLGAPPEKVYREYKIPADAWGMFRNDSISDCTCAAIAHMLMLVTAHTGKLLIPDEGDIIKAYSAITGYDPATGANDNGADLPTVLNYWRDTGVAGHKIVQWGDVDHTSIDMQKHAIDIFGATDDALAFPISAERQFDAGADFALVNPDGGNAGGHCVPRFGYGSVGATCVTWARTVGGPWDWWMKYLFESTAVITQDWINQASGLTPGGFKMDALLTVIKELA
ncbi:MAG TPA: hypothetical protein VND65_01760 [Candidatus Binatia bacterium]|nr:hypothetical protein [Candidatus Binatia bacterium]